MINFIRKGVYDDLIRAGTDAEITPVRLTALKRRNPSLIEQRWLWRASAKTLVIKAQ